MIDDKDEFATEPTRTTWYNPHPSKEARFVLLVNHGTTNRKPVKFQHVIKPLQSKEIDSVFDSAIRMEDGQGNIVGGLVPWLRKGKDPEADTAILPKVLDWAAQKEESDIEAAMARIEKEAIRERAIEHLNEKKNAKK